MAKETPSKPVAKPKTTEETKSSIADLYSIKNGDLNTLRNVDDTMDINGYNDDFFVRVSQYMDRVTKPDVLRGVTGPFKAIVLRVEELEDKKPTKDGKLTFFGQTIDVGSIVGGDVIPKLAIKARIPELHSTLPIPSKEELNAEKKKKSNNSKSQKPNSVDFYPTFVAKSNRVSKEEKPEVGEIVWVDFQNIEGMSGGIYLGQIHNKPSVAVSSGGNVVEGKQPWDKRVVKVRLDPKKLETLQQNIDVAARYKDSMEDRVYIENYHWKFYPCLRGEDNAIETIALSVPHFKYYKPEDYGFKWNPKNTVAFDGIGVGGTELILNEKRFWGSKAEKEAIRRAIEAKNKLAKTHGIFKGSQFNRRISEYSWGFAVAYSLLDILRPYFNVYITRKDFAREHGIQRAFWNNPNNNIDIAIELHINGLPPKKGLSKHPGTTMLVTSKYNGQEHIDNSLALATILSKNIMSSLGTEIHRRAVLQLPKHGDRASLMFRRMSNLSAYVITESFNGQNAYDAEKALTNYDKYIKSLADSIMEFYRDNMSEKYNRGSSGYKYGF